MGRQKYLALAVANQRSTMVTRYTDITPVIVAPKSAPVVPLPPGLVTPQEKPDGEIAASQRWLTAWGTPYSAWRITIGDDDLYCHQPFCQEAIEQGFEVLVVGKPSSHLLLYEWIADLERTNPIQKIEPTRWDHCH
ncbi:MAG: hypothetical protein HC877_04280 [Thioploca sp.]|nr:hypothetical protein [Thioploca sp.]